MTKKRCILLISALLPGIFTLIYFHTNSPVNRITALISKLLIIFIPITFLRFAKFKIPHEFFKIRGTKESLLFLLITGISIYGSYFYYFKDSVLFSSIQKNAMELFLSFGITSVWGFLGIALFTSIFNSLMEEMYWRIYLFRTINQESTLTLSIMLSGLSFLLHHIVALEVYLGGHFFIIGFFCFNILLGHIFWCWHYKKYQSLTSIFINHLIINLFIMHIAYLEIYS